MAAGIGGGCGGGSGSITINGGTVIAFGNSTGEIEEDDPFGIAVGGAGIGAGDEATNGENDKIVINGGTVTAYVPNDNLGAAIGNGGGDGNDVSVTIGATATVLAGPNSDGTDAEVKTDAANNTSYKYAHVTFSAHTHYFTYSASDATIVATCVVESCSLTSNPTLTIGVPAKTTYGDANSAEATLTGLDDFNAATGLSVSANDSIQYYRATKSGNTYAKGSVLAAAPTDAGDYLAELTLTGVMTDAGNNEEVSVSIGYTINQREAKLSWKNTSFTYDDKSHVPTATVSNLVSGDECAVTVSGAKTDAGTYTATATELTNANYKLPGKATQQFTINQASIAKAKVTLATTSYTYNGKARKPAVKSVVLGGKTLKAGTDYTVKYADNVNPGTANVTITGKGSYKGTVSKAFTIAAVKPTWSGAASMPVSSTAEYAVKNGTIKVKSGSSFVSVKGNTVTAKKAGTATLARYDEAGKQRATKNVEVYELSGKYVIQSVVNSNYVLDIRGKSKANSARMIVWPRNGGSNQKCEFVRQSDGTYGIKCVHSGKYVDVQGGGTKRSQPVIQYTWNGGKNQRWKITVDAKNRLTFVSAKSGMAFDIQGGKVTKRAQMIQYTINGGNNQKWVLKRK